jgi:hypothetical protein
LLNCCEELIAIYQIIQAIGIQKSFETIVTHSKDVAAKSNQ